MRIKEIITQFINRGISRSLVLFKYIESTLLMVFSKKNKSIGSMMVRITIENILAFITGSGIKRGVFEK